MASEGMDAPVPIFGSPVRLLSASSVISFPAPRAERCHPQISNLLSFHPVASGATRNLSCGVLKFFEQGLIFLFPFPALPCPPSPALTLPSPSGLDLTSTPLTLKRRSGVLPVNFLNFYIAVEEFKVGVIKLAPISVTRPVTLSFLSPCVRHFLPRLCYKWPALHSTHLKAGVSGGPPQDIF